MTPAHPTLPLWDEPRPDHRARILAHAQDRVAWMRHRSRGVTGTDAARLSSPRAVVPVVREKVHGSSFLGNVYTDHGRNREPEIARWVRDVHGIPASGALFHAEANRQHLATPDGLRVHEGRIELVEIKTTSREWKSVPRNYLRQVWWQQYVLGAERTLVVWERHVDFEPVGEPECRWIDRDDNEIHRLVTLADQVLELLRR